jgi:hypothetical protein
MGSLTLVYANVKTSNRSLRGIIMRSSRFLVVTSILFLTFFLPSSLSYASEKAITGTGEVVILNADGTWKYENESIQSSKTIKTNPNKFQKSEDSTFAIKSKINDLSVWINPVKWGFAKKGSVNSAAEYELKHKSFDIYGLVINEEVEIPIEDLAGIALNFLLNQGSDVKAVNKEYRVVNGNKVLFMETEATVSGIKATYMTYYYSNSRGASQLIAFTGRNLADKYESEIFELLNGLIVQ